jgi:hypothetical protein
VFFPFDATSNPGTRHEEDPRHFRPLVAALSAHAKDTVDTAVGAGNF